MSEYDAFLETKRIKVEPTGSDPGPTGLDYLKPHQEAILRWSLARGKAAIFADCGLGKTLIELHFARVAAERTGLPSLILTPLAVTHQIMREAERFGVAARIVADQSEIGRDVNIANYQKLHKFDRDKFGAIACDESGILKAFDGSTRKDVTDFASVIPYRLAATATPAPNDRLELSNHAEFLGIMTGKEIIARFFTQDGNSAQNFRLKGHAVADYWAWVKQWAVALRFPSDLGFSDDGYVLPPLDVRRVVLDSKALPGELFPMAASGLNEQRKARRHTIDDRVKAVADLVAVEPDEAWVIWCELNDEATAVAKAIPGAVEVAGSHSDDEKAERMLGFADGKFKVLVTKPKIGAFGMNWQHCARVAFVGVSHSFEQTYQAIRRCWRFGQSRPVVAHFISTERDEQIMANVRRKEAEAAEMFARMVRPEGLILDQASRDETPYNPTHPIVLPAFLRAS